MRQSASKSLILALLALLSACSQEPQGDFRGQLYFASGNYIGQFDIANGSSTIIANRGAVTVRHVSRYSDNRLMLAELATVNDREVPRISWIDVETGQSDTLYRGHSARYLPTHRAVVFDDGSRLRLSSRARDESMNAEIKQHDLNQPTAFVHVPDDLVLFEIGAPEDREVYSFNVLTKELAFREALTQRCRLDGAVWITDRQQLACPSRSSGAYLLSDIDGNARGELDLPQDKEFVALAYAEDQRALFLTERWRSLFGSERFAVWAYDLVTGQSYRLVRDQYLGGSAVYTKD